MSENTERALPLRTRLGDAFDRAERVYLRVLRAFILIMASLLLVYAAWLVLSGMYKMSKSEDSIQEKIASVSGTELAATEVSEAQGNRGDGSRRNEAEYRKFYDGFVGRYHSLFQTTFEAYRRPDDKQLSKSEFDDAFVHTSERIAAIKDDELDFAEDKADLGLLLEAMSAAAIEQPTQDRLLRYKNAKMTQVCSYVTKTRTTYRRGWDSYSTSCSNWYETPIGCAVNRSVQTPYKEKVCSMKLPSGVTSYAQIFRGYQERFFEILAERRKANADEASSLRAAIAADNLSGQASLSDAVKLFGGFLAVMFFFLLIAIERHQRNLATVTPAKEPPTSNA